MKSLELDAIRKDPEQLVQLMESGEDFVVVDRERRLAEVHPVPARRNEPRLFGLAAGKIEVADDFDRPMVLVDDPEVSDRFDHIEVAARGEFLEWEGNLLIYTWPIPAGWNGDRLVQKSREDRTRQILWCGETAIDSSAERSE